MIDFDDFKLAILLFLTTGIMSFMSNLNFMLSLVEHEKRFITSRPGPLLFPAEDNTSSFCIPNFVQEQDIVLI